ncbi:inactive C-alpha-formylglycine-generating enzyme 2 isoform X2 [Petromyzon marinus]|uniref:Inactive C-alpha-formylglycine-generating enzyme 2 isoform X2 n=1 Tax=Petromyzon marinus TaxID=7757 RepID=A0AAJ7SQ16_PETMA|nr:inactive C-alpha-formylglycine-generating enzyme 2 isoform X2 [Petromyzon marinus]
MAGNVAVGAFTMALLFSVCLGDAAATQVEAEDGVVEDDVAEVEDDAAESDGMVEIPGGVFRMGTDAEDARDGEGPSRPVAVASFWLDRRPVTNERFREFVRSRRYRTEAEGFGWSFVFQDFVPEELKSKVTQRIESAPWWMPVERAYWRQPFGPGSGIRDRLDHPVVHVSLRDATAFCSWAGKRLPSEEEWERAARGRRLATASEYPWGENFETGRANLWQGAFPDADAAADGFHGTSPVDAFPAQTDFGLRDMVGNVWEWTDSEFANPGARSQPMSVLRGASWIDTADGSANHRARVTTRMGNTPDSASDNLGFRCARSLDDGRATEPRSRGRPDEL